MKTVTLKQFKKMNFPTGSAAALLPMIAIKDPYATKKEPRNPIGYYVPGHIMRNLAMQIRTASSCAEDMQTATRRAALLVAQIPGGRALSTRLTEKHTALRMTRV